MRIIIFDILNDKNLSVYWLSKNTGISEQLLGKYKNNKIDNVTLKNAYKIAKALDIKIDDLIEED